ncbi:MAG: VCBS repeat-containing protein, partial [Fidelibacterota bacterium]
QTSTPGVGSGPYFVSAGDLDSDGDLDLAVVNYYSNTVSILTGDGSGAFSQTSAPGVGTYPMSVTTGDWDNDGDLDLAVGVWNSARVTILSNNGSGSFTNTKNISSGYYVRSVVHGDWDGDGSLDLAASNSNHDRVSIFQNKTAINIAIAPDSLDYGIIKTNTSKELFFSISNTGQYQTLEVTNIVSSNPSFSVTPSSVSIAPNTTDSIMVTFTPIEVGVYNDTLTIYSNDPDEPEKIHLLYGTGAPAVLSTIPPANSPGADSRTIVSATFNTAIREATLNPASIHIIGDVSGECICSISYDSLSQTVVLKPDSNFIYGEQVSVILTDSIKAVNGDVALQAGYSWNFFVSPLFGTGNFELDTVGYKSGGGPFTAVPGDFNRDGFADLAAANDGDNSVSVFLNDKSRSFVAPVHYATGAAPQGIAVSDLNSDGYPDIIAANNGSDNISVLINNGDGTFAVASNYPVETNPRPLAVGDLDNDGDMDVVVANVSSNDISVLINDGAGAYAADTVITVGDAPSGIVLQDLDGDADVDIAVSNKNSNNISILLNQMPGFTTSSPHSSGSDSNPNDLVAIDLNDDGSVDLATANRTSDNIALLFNNGDATFTTPSMIPVGDQPIDLYAHDFDADGDADLAVLDYGDFDVRTFLNDGLGSFIGSDTVSVVGGPRSLTGLDISGKIGIIDLMVVDILRDSILVIKNRIKEGILATTHLRRSGEQSGNVVFDYLAYNSSSADSMGLVAEYSRSGDLAWLPASVTGDTSRLPPGINEGEFIWNSENDLPSVDLDSARFRIIAYSGPQKDTSQAIFFPLDNFHGQSVSVALTDTLSEYSDSVHIKVVLVDTTYDVLSISGFYNVAGGGDSSATLIGDLVGLDSSRYVLDVVWNSGADLPNTELDSVQLKIIPSDGWAESAADSTVVFSLDNNLPPSVAIPDFPGEQSGDVFVVYQLTDEEHDTLAIDLYYSTGSDPSWKKATVTGDTIDVVDYADTLVWHSLIDLNTIDDTTTRLLLIPRDKDAGFADTTAAFHLDNNQLPGIVLSELDGYYQGDITISYTLNDPESDPISLLVEYKQKPATSWDSASVEDDITDLTVYQDSLVWNSLSDLPDYTGQVAFRIIPLDNDPGQPDTIVFFVNQIGAPVVAVHDVLPAHNSSCCWYDKIQVTLSKSIDVSTVTPNVEVQGIHTGEVTIIPAVQDTLLFLTPDSPFTSLDSITVELKADMTDIYGLYLDGNNNGAPDGSPDDDYVWNFSVTALGDFNLDSMVDQSDLNLFRAAWFKRPQDLQYELGPFQGEIPHLRLVPDNSLDFDDLVVFAGMWNWSQANVNPVINLNTLAKANVGETLLRFEPVFLDNYMWADISERSFALELWIEEDGLPIGLGITMLLDPNVMRYKGFESSDSLGKELNGWFTLDKYYEESGLLVLNMANFSTSSNGASPPGYIGRLNAEVLQVSETAVPFKYDLWMTGADDSLYQGLTMVHISTAPPLPTEFALHQNYPNPFNPSTTIRFELPEAVDVHLMVYDILGREIVRLKNERMEAGYHQVRWNGRDGLGRFIASGIYFARMATPGYSKTVKMLLLK